MAGKRMFERSSRECDLIHMTPELADAIKAWAEKEERTELLAQAIAGCETASTVLKRGFMSRVGKMPKEQLCGMLLTPTWLIWATKADDNAPFAVGVRLADAEIKDYLKDPDYALAADDGVRVFGFIGHAPERGSVFLGLGEDVYGRAFKEKLLATWRAARPD